MVRPIRSYSTSAGGGSRRSNQRSLSKDLSKEGQTIRLRSGSAGGRPVKSRDEDEEHEPIQVKKSLPIFLQNRSENVF